MLEIIRESGDPDFFANALIEALSVQLEPWDAEQRFRMARLLAQDGNEFARRAMYAAFPSLGETTNDVAVEFVELDGIEGLLYVAAEIGTQLAQSSERWEDESLLLEATALLGGEAVTNALATAATGDPRIRIYLDAVEANRALRASSASASAENLNYEEVRARIESRDWTGILSEWSRTASDADIALAARDLAQQTEPQKLLPYLRLFLRRPFPLDVDLLLRLVDQPDGPVPRHALRALANIGHDKIRSLAFSLVNSGASNRMYAVDLLVKNFRPGDHALVAGWWDAESDPDQLQCLGSSLVTFLAAYPHPSIEPALLRSIYEKQPCAHCRCSVVERLLELGALPPDLRRECEFDSHLDTRRLVRC